MSPVKMKALPGPDAENICCPLNGLIHINNLGGPKSHAFVYIKDSIRIVDYGGGNHIQRLKYPWYSLFRSQRAM